MKDFPLSAMPTQKKRINVSMPDDVVEALSALAERDNVPQATKALQLIQLALELEEDAYFAKIADERAKKSKAFVSHEEFWSKLL